MFTRAGLSGCVRRITCLPRRRLETSAPLWCSSKRSANNVLATTVDLEDNPDVQLYNLTGVKTAKSYNLNVLENNQLVPIVGGLPHDASKVTRTDLGFVFEFGAFVLWNASLVDQGDLRVALKPAEECPILDESLVRQEVDALQCCIRPDSHRPQSSAGQRKWWIERETIMLSDSLSAEDLLEYQLAISHALALSVQLGIIEKRVEEAKSKVHSLAERGEVTKWRRSKQPHQLALRICQLRFDASEQPDLNEEGFYWNRPRIEELHLEVLKIQDYNSRVRAVIKKLDFCSELVTRLVDEQSTLHNSRLELIIIFLIAFECVQELYRIHESRQRARNGHSISN
ncbi:uncharacterized protein LOC135821016 [Sycon ciliatum]|uniref:uncharacterized protein LOC135821016 n=1 Tax=Sycon ciliatum TaxID=27933 RepID=UPI0020AAF0BC|eukprot:scpid73318/ scgid29809/ 